MTRITIQDGKVVLRDGKIGTEEACCCGGVCPPGSQCCGNFTYIINYCEQVNGEWVQTNFPNPGDPCECCDGSAGRVVFEGDLFGFGPIRILECSLYWCGEEVSGIPDYCCGDNLTQEQSDFCSRWFLRLSGLDPSDLIAQDAVCASAYDAEPGSPNIGCYENPLP